MILTLDPVRLGGAALLVAAWLALSVAKWRGRRRHRHTASTPADWLVIHASQTGNAEALATRTAALLATGGLAARAASMAVLDDAMLRAAKHILFIASTYGEGDAPDAAARFAGTSMAGGADLTHLPHLHYAVLAPTCMAADALSTALTVMGVEAGLPFADRRGLAARFLLRQDGGLREVDSAAWRNLLQ